MSDSDQGFAKTYGVELLFESDPAIDIDSALVELQKALGEIVHENAGEQHMFFLSDHKVGYKDGNQVPSQLVLLHAEPSKDSDPLQEEIQQSWNTPNASEIVNNTTRKVLLTDLMGAGLDTKERHQILSNAIKIFVKYSNCHGIANKRTQQIISAPV